MRNLIGAEWTRLMRVGMLLGAGAIVGLGILTTAIIFGQASDDAEPGIPGVVGTSLLEGDDGLVQAMAFSSQIVGGASLVLFARTVTNDYQYGTLKVLLTREPRRLAFLLAKFLAMAAFLVFTLVAMLLAMVSTASIMAAVRGIDISQWWTVTGIAASLLGFLRLVVAALVWGLFGFALGTIFRSAGPAIGIGIGVFAIGGHLVERFWSNAAEWFPSIVLGVFTAGGTNAVSLIWASFMVAMYAITLSATSAFGFSRGDVPG